MRVRVFFFLDPHVNFWGKVSPGGITPKSKPVTYQVLLCESPALVTVEKMLNAVLERSPFNS